MRRSRRGPRLLTIALAPLAALAVAPLVALAVVVVAASYIHVSRSSQPSTTRPAPAGRTASPARSAPVRRTQNPKVDLAGLRWTSYHGVELPSSPLAGPRDTADGLASGFADTPLGALLAAVNIAVRANAQWGPGVFVPTIRKQVTGPDAAALLASSRAAYSKAARAAGITGGQSLGSVRVTEQAFRWVIYSPSDATIDLVSAGPGSGGHTVRVVTRVEVIWDGTDWKVVAPPGGDWADAASLLTSLHGYTIFPGQG